MPVPCEPSVVTVITLPATSEICLAPKDSKAYETTNNLTADEPKYEPTYEPTLEATHESKCETTYEPLFGNP